MKHLLFNRDHQLRNGWWILIFLAMLATTRVIYTPVSKGLQALGVPAFWLGPLPVVFILLISWLCMCLRRQAPAELGLKLNRTWGLHVAVGTGIGMLQIFIAVGLICLMGGLSFKFNPNFGPGTFLSGLYALIFAVLLEELLFRGFLFQRLVAGTRPWFALISMGVLFGIGHWTNPEMQGSTKVWASLDLALGGIVLGLAYLRTGSLALPIGLHLGWNGALGQFFGLGVSGYAHTGLLQPIDKGKAEWLTGGAFGPEASIFAVVVDAALLFLLCRWQGSRQAQTGSSTDKAPAFSHAEDTASGGKPGSTTGTETRSC